MLKGFECSYEFDEEQEEKFPVRVERGRRLAIRRWSGESTATYMLLADSGNKT